jgi:hypothetical protein
MPDNMSFLPEDYLEKRVARRTNLICITLFGVVMVCVAGAYFVTDRQTVEIRKQQAAVNQQFEEAARRLEQLEKLQAQKQQMIHKAQIASVLVERVPRTLLLAEVVNHMPANLSLLEFNLRTETRRAPAPRTAIERETNRRSLQDRARAAQPQIEVPQTDVTIRMVGVAPNDVELAKFITAMSNHTLFTDAILQYTEQTVIDERDLRKFSVELKLNQDVDLRVIEPTLVRRDLKMDPMSGTIQITEGQLVVPSAEAEITPAADHR